MLFSVELFTIELSCKRYALPANTAGLPCPLLKHRDMAPPCGQFVMDADKSVQSSLNFFPIE